MPPHGVARCGVQLPTNALHQGGRGIVIVEPSGVGDIRWFLGRGSALAARCGPVAEHLPRQDGRVG
jgi:hypothetical protein